ncbi:MAG: FAD-binding oxidoreductase [Anaerolineales bacterium]
MKRWNGWGNIRTDYPLPASARDYLIAFFGPLDPRPDADFESVLRSVPPARLPAHPLVDASPEARLTHARGQSLPDWVALRSGRIPAFPDGVAFPQNEADVRGLLTWARQTGAAVIPYGGGTSVVGHINPPAGPAPALTLSLERMTRLLDLDEVGQTALFEAGVTGPALEAALAQRGYTLGHFPQSHEYSTLGGWIAARSSGQQSYHYGRIEQLFLGGHVETPRGPLHLLPLPASAAGPEVREMVLGSEGRLGVITQARVRISRLPEAEEFYGVFFPTWEQGREAVRQMAQERLPVSMMRLSNPQETETTLILSGKAWVPAAVRGLALMGYGVERSLLVFGVTGSAAHVRRTRAQAAAICRKHGGLFVGTPVGHTWRKSRFLAPYLRNTLWEAGVAVDTLETLIPWARVGEASQAIPAAIVAAMEKFNERVLAFAHLSHIYREAASIYTTFLFRRTEDPDELLERWRAMKHAASLTIQQFGGTITHQHGIGSDHAPYLPAEKGPLGMEAIRAVCQVFDPDGMMNPGKLFVR